MRPPRTPLDPPEDPVASQAGPAPLQNSVHTPETFEAVLDVNNGATANVANAQRAILDVNEMAQRLLHRNPEDPVPTYSNDCTSATFRQPEVLTTEGFASMTKTRFAWARTFPTLFPPPMCALKATGDFAFCMTSPGDTACVISL